MTLVDRYLLRRTVAALLRTVVALLGMYVLVDLLTHRLESVGETPLLIIVQYYVCFIPFLLYAYIAPFAVLIAGLLVLGETAQNNEVTALLASGVSLRRFVRWPVIAALLFAVGLFAMQETVGAHATRRAHEIENSYFSRNPLAENRGAVSWSRLSGDWTVLIEKFNRLALTGEGVHLHSIGQDAVEQIDARRIFWDESKQQWILERGRWLTFPPDVDEVQTRRISQMPAPFDETPTELFALEEPADAKTAAELSADLRAAELRRRPVQGKWVYYHAKFSQPAASFVMIFLAVPFAMRLRRGGLAIGFGMSLAIGIAYLMLSNTAVFLGASGHANPVVAAWLANGVFFILGVALFFRTPT
ncbi:MAG: LptF/LptG family permease [Candidatus Hydrogenedentes bacterium]|nr:LptF/LptG family permease [Candidatus Hydrogenedentota bacterium]